MAGAVVPALAGAGLGAIIGSFLGAIVMRWPRGESVMKGRSYCDACGRTLGVVDLIPLFGALIQRGRCRRCGARIDPAHMLMEAGCALIGGVALGTLPLLAGLLVAMGGWLLLTLAIFDARHFWLPDLLTLPLAVIGLTIGDWILPAPFWDRATGAALGYGLLFALAWGYRRFRGRDGLGLGDAKLLGAIGAWMGWQALPLVLLLASSAGLLWVLIQALRGRAVERGTRVPLGTFLCCAVPAAMVAGHLLGS
ncbi:MAG TPA: A24 family peptidase [Sphingobium sp.]|nr:A24 family peptidase [Sphingobium sp.]